MSDSFKHEALYIYLDIETIPSQDPAVKAEIEARYAVSDEIGEIKPAANLKDPAKIAEDIERRRAKAIEDLAAAKVTAAQKADDEWRKTALDGALGHAISCAWAFGDDEIDYIGPGDIDHRWTAQPFDGKEPDYQSWIGIEAERLEIFFDKVKKVTLERSRIPIIVAHHAQFDITFLWHRAVILGVKPPTWWPIHEPTWSERVVDTQALWAGSRGNVKLDKLCRVLGIPGKGDFDGSMVYDAWASGQHEIIREYNKADVERLRSVHRRLTFTESAVEYANRTNDWSRLSDRDLFSEDVQSGEPVFNPAAMGDA